MFSCAATTDPDANAEAEDLNTDALSLISAGSYEDAAIKYQEIIELGETDFLEVATIGLAFCDMKTGNSSEAKSQLVLALSTYPSNIDAKALLSLINYAISSNTVTYEEAYTYGAAVIAANSSFVSSYTTAINDKDIRLTMALSKFRLGELVAAYNIVSDIAGVTPGFDTNASDFESALLELLEDLSDEFSN